MTTSQRILFMVTADVSVRLLRGSGAYLKHAGWDVHIAASPGPNLEAMGAAEGISTHSIPMERHISPLRDLRALLQVFRLMRTLKPSVVSAGTPKAGLLGSIAARLTPGVRCAYLLRGLRLESSHGLQWLVLYVSEWLACRAADIVIPISPSLAARTRSLHLAARSKIRTVGAGSSNGVDVERFSRSGGDSGSFTETRYPRPVIGFVGRVTHDKGLSLLSQALRLLKDWGISGTLLVAGADDGPEAQMLRAKLDASGWHVVHLGFVEETERIYPLMDVLCFPSRREGFGNVVLEAAVAGVPTVAVEATGVVDAVVDGQTGLVARPTAPEPLARALYRLVSDDDLRNALGSAARERAITHFDQEVVWSLYEETYRRLALPA